ncbi:unnamed protein product [Bursaphelenchus xylophilus]|uniref:(pine wood nematode) hypothetical protein n=1 Tax=Bursaphelenchus xylophilus TaxID=6326 RepID=A0A1I7RWM9_BURXY|nr:unnamed protein product [Bursaphelenchus xylophilus]CAG9128501.1 unnamed protein product [Bursaphelenchus xylophilus]
MEKMPSLSVLMTLLILQHAGCIFANTGDGLNGRASYNPPSTYPSKFINYPSNPLNYTQRPLFMNYSTIHSNTNFTWPNSSHPTLYNMSSLNFLPRLYSAKSFALPDYGNSSSKNAFNHHDNDEILEEHYTFGTYDIIHRIHNHELNEKSSHDSRKTPYIAHDLNDQEEGRSPKTGSAGPPAAQPSGYSGLNNLYNTNLGGYGTENYSNRDNNENNGGYSSEIDETDIRRGPFSGNKRAESGEVHDGHVSGYQTPNYLMNYLKNVKSPASVWSSGWIPIDDGNTMEKRTVWWKKDDRRA